MSDQTRKPTPMPGSFLAPQADFLTTEDAQASYGFAAAPLVGGAEPEILPERLDEIRYFLSLHEGCWKSPQYAEQVIQELLGASDNQAAALTTERQHREKAEAAVAILSQQLANAATGWRETMESAKTLEGLAGMQAVEIADLNKRNAMLADDNGSLEKEAASLRARLEEEKTTGAESEKLELVKGVKRIHSRLFHVTSKRDVLELARNLRIELGDLVAGFTEKIASPAPVQGEGEEEREVIGTYEVSGLPVYEGDNYRVDIEGCYLTPEEAEACRVDDLGEGEEGKEAEVEKLYVAFKSTRLYPGGNGYGNSSPAPLAAAQRLADELGQDNPAGFVVHEYFPESK